MTTARDRYRGALLGLATGDALGTTVEFAPPGRFPPVTDIVGGGPFRLEAGQWTDDTSMALCLAESLLERRSFDPVDQLGRYVRWYREGHLSSTGACFDVGQTVLGALGRFERTGDPNSGATNEWSAGNGSIMRLAPVPLYFARDPAVAIERCADSSRTTHAATTAVDACRYLGGLIVGAVKGVTKAALLANRFEAFPGCWSERPLTPEIDDVASGSFRDREPPEIEGTGYVVRSLEAALWAFDRSESFRSGCLLAANLGHDSDTTAAVYGQLAGAFYGVGAIPVEWRARIAQRELIEDLADRLLVQSASAM